VISELFYEERLHAEVLTHSRVVQGHRWLNAAGLWFVAVDHEGNQNSCAERVEVVAQIVEGLLKPEVKWFYGAGNCRPLRNHDILIVAPYNAQVADLSARLPNMPIGTVDKFSGAGGGGCHLFDDDVITGRGAARDGILVQLESAESPHPGRNPL
jgi:hypothetical protein